MRQPKEKYNLNLRKNIYYSIKVLIFVIIFLLCFQVLNNIMKEKSSFLKSADFFEQKEDFDVLFFGSSHTMTAISPMQLWKEHGIVSYNMGQVCETITQNYYNILLALKETKPKLIVLDTYLVSHEYKLFMENDGPRQIHETFDVYPISFTKYTAIKDIFDNKDLQNNLAEYLFYFSLYHSRWKDLSSKDFYTDIRCLKGEEMLIKVETDVANYNYDSVETYRKEENISMVYLRKIIEYCKNNNIEILLTYLPFPATKNDIAISKYVNKLSNEYKIKYLNFLNMNIVDFETDCYDKNSHLNASGARKVTSYLGKYIVENYNIKDQSNNYKYINWNIDYEKYCDYKYEELKNAEFSLDNFLMLLYNENDIKYDVKVSSNYNFEENKKIKKLLENLKYNYEINDTVFKDKKNKKILITLYSTDKDKTMKKIWF